MTKNSMYLCNFQCFFFFVPPSWTAKAGHISISHTAVSNTFVTNRKSCTLFKEAGPTHFLYGLTVRRLFRIWSYLFMFLCVFIFFSIFLFMCGPTIIIKIKSDTTKVPLCKTSTNKKKMICKAINIQNSQSFVRFYFIFCRFIFIF